jgi:hypothetical protein
MYRRIKLTNSAEKKNLLCKEIFLQYLKDENPTLNKKKYQ